MELKSVHSFLEHYRLVRKRTKKLITIIPPDRLDWAYMPAKFSIGDQLRHIAAIERYLFAEVAAGRKSAYHGCGRHLADGYENVVNYFNRLHSESLKIFSSFEDKDLEKECITPGNTKIKIGKWLMMMAEHEIHHRAQLYLYLNILNINTPPMFGLTAEEVAQKSFE